MRKLALSIVAAAAMSLATASNAAITILGSSNVDAPITVVNGALQSTVDFGKNPEPSGVFNGWIEFSNNLGGLYSIIVSTSTPFATITNATLSGLGGAGVIATNAGATNSLSLFVPNLAAGSYRFAFAGTAPANGGVATGNLTFQVVPVPEPATWGMMLIGFAGIGLAMRSRRRPVLAQVA
jgi:hypothetical protein